MMATAAPTTWMVLGLAATGRSIARWLSQRDDRVVLVDDQITIDRAAFEAILPRADIVLGQSESVSLDGVDTVITSPGYAPTHPLLRRAAAEGVPIVSDVELFCREARGSVVAVTGSNGKSTVVTLLNEMCQAAGVKARAGANLGTPALDLLSPDEEMIYLLELSSFQLERTDSLNAHVATVLNLSEDHIDWHGSLAAYRAAKLKIYEHCEFAVINGDQPSLSPAPDNDALLVEFVSGEPGSRQFGVTEVSGEQWLCFGDQALIAVADCALRGEHNIANMLAALAIASAIDLPLSAMRDVLRRFRGLAHRHQHVGDFQGVSWINDSKATNIGASLASIEAVSGPIILLLGGRTKGESLDALIDQLPTRVKFCVVYGENRAQLATLLEARLRDHASVASLDEAVNVAASVARVGDTVLLAPAAASQDAFSNYAARGDRFVELVRERCA
ncbi:MAG: UDP-N-acetylmuramoyl-L-alanine--D-glutamate ligase [Pseudomonadota bacterium]